MFQSFLLVLSICIDSFVASISYGTNKIKIPFLSTLIICIIGSLSLGVSLFFGDILKNYLPSHIATFFSFIILMCLGIYRFFEGIFKLFIQSKKIVDSPLKFKIFDMNFVLQVYAYEIKADFDNSKTLSFKEAIYLGLGLSFDSIAVGFGSSLTMTNYFEVIILSFLIGIISILLGVIIGKVIAKKTNINLSWLSGAILMILATIRVIK